MANQQKEAADRAKAIAESQGGYYSKDQWVAADMPLKGKPKLVDGGKKKGDR